MRATFLSEWRKQPRTANPGKFAAVAKPRRTLYESATEVRNDSDQELVDFLTLIHESVHFMS